MRRRTLTVIIVFTVLISVVCSCSSGQTGSNESGEINYVIRDNTPVYSASDDTSPKLTFLDEGDHVMVVSSDGQFSKIMISDHLTGYINNRFLSPDDLRSSSSSDGPGRIPDNGGKETTDASVPETVSNPQKIECISVYASDYHTDSRDLTEYVGDLTVDGKLETAWNVRGGDTNDDPNTNGVGQFIDFHFPEGTKLSSIKIYPGYCSDAASFDNNYVPTALTLASGDKEYKLELGEYARNYGKAAEGYEYSFGEEWFELEDGVLTITIDSVWSKNRKWQDCCIAEVVFYGESGS